MAHSPNRGNEADAVPRAGSAVRHASWLVHAALVALVGGYIVLSAWQGTPDANIGLGLGLLALGVMAVPWSLPLFLDPASIDTQSYAVFAGGTVLNLVLHAVVLRGWEMLRGRRASR